MKNLFEMLSFTASDFVVTRLQAIVWVNSGLGLSYMVEKKSADFMTNLYSEYHADKPLIVNCKGISEIDDHALDTLFSSIEKINRTLILLNSNQLYVKITQQKKNSSVDIKYSHANNFIMLGKEIDFDVANVNREIDRIKNIFVKKIVRDSFVHYEKPSRLLSTPIIADGEFDSNYIISNRKHFLWTCIFLRDKIDQIFDDSLVNRNTQKIKLLSASLRGSAFVASVGLLSELSFDTVDHFGPNQKIFDKDFGSFMDRNIEYIYIGDFLIGGTELKIAKTYSELNGCTLNNAVVVGSLIEPEYFQSSFNIFSLSNLREAMPNITYTV